MAEPPSKKTVPARTGAREKERGSKRPVVRPRMPTLLGVAPAAASDRTPPRSIDATSKGAVEAVYPIGGPVLLPRSSSRERAVASLVRRGRAALEHRRFYRVPIEQSLFFAAKDENDFFDGTGVDIALGGMFIATEFPASFATELMIHTPLGAEGEFALPGIVRWTKANGMGVQFGSLGAKETFAIMEILRRYEELRSRGG